jgi:predicted DNA-binding transcriptional regulator AlpA
MIRVPAEHLGGTAEVAELLGCTRQQIYSLRQRDDFPEPVTRLAATPVWDLRNVLEFKGTWVRRSVCA